MEKPYTVHTMHVGFMIEGGRPRTLSVRFGAWKDGRGIVRTPTVAAFDAVFAAAKQLRDIAEKEKTLIEDRLEQ